MAKSQGVVVSTSNSPVLVKLSQPLLMAYRELFAVVFKIPNESVKTRVSHAILAALNGDSPLRSCQRCSGRVETSERSSQTTSDEKEAAETDTEKSQIISIGGVVKLGRKRRILAPQASTGADLGVSLSRRQKQPRPSQTKRKSRAESTEHFQDLTGVIEAAVDSNIEDIEDMIKDVVDYKTPKNLDKLVKDMMLRDWIECIVRKDGKLPIHNAVQDSDEIYLRRQCLTLKNRALGVDLKTTEGYTALHIALMGVDPDIQIIEVLLNAGADVSVKDPNGNNCVLLAAKYTRDHSVFTTILRKTPFSDLQSENFNSHGIFRVVVDSGRVDFLTELIKYVDECLGLESLVPRTVDEKVIGSLCRERLRSLGAFMNRRVVKKKEIIENKEALLNQRDKTAGKTPLFCAVEKQKEIIVLVLLANCADPQIKTHAGIEPYTLASEVLKNKKISTYLISSISAFEAFFGEVHQISSIRESSHRTIIEDSSDEDEGESQKKRRKLSKN